MATPPIGDRVLNPMIRDKIHEPWRDVSWDEAIAFTARRFKEIQAKYGKDSVGVITSSRCTNEESYLVQKLVRAASATTTSTLARASAIRRPATASTRPSALRPERRISIRSTRPTSFSIIGCNPTDAHPVFGSRMKKRLREGAKLIVVDPRRIDLVRSPHVEADYHLPLKPGTNVAVVTALAHVIVTEGLVNENFVRERCDWDEFQDWAAFVAEERNSPEATREIHRRSGRRSARGRAALRHRRQCGDLLRPWRDGAQPGLHHGHGHRQSRHGDRQSRSSRRRREPAARPEQCAGLLRHGLVPARIAGLSAYFRRWRRARRSRPIGASSSTRNRACASPTCSTRPSTARSRAFTCRARTFCSPIPTPSMSPPASPRWNWSWCRTCSWSRRRITPMSSCRARPSSKRTAPSPTPNAASSACAR